MEKIYELRKKFALIGITGRTGSGCSQISKLLGDVNYIKNLNNIENTNGNVDILKHNICLNYLKHENNWEPFRIIKHTNVVLFHLIYECCFESTLEEAQKKFTGAICAGKGKEFMRFSSSDNEYDKIKEYAYSFIEKLHPVFESYGCETLELCISNKETFYSDYFDNTNVMDSFIGNLKDFDAAKANLFFHDSACNLRSSGKALIEESKESSSEYIYILLQKPLIG